MAPKNLSNVFLQITLATSLWVACFSHPYPFIRAGNRKGDGRDFTIRHLPCANAKQSGVCMFAWDCMKVEGTHLGTCIDRFYFGSCCKMKIGTRTPVHKPMEADIHIPTTLTSLDNVIKSDQETSDVALPVEIDGAEGNVPVLVDRDETEPAGVGINNDEAAPVNSHGTEPLDTVETIPVRNDISEINGTVDVNSDGGIPNVSAESMTTVGTESNQIDENSTKKPQLDETFSVNEIKINDETPMTGIAKPQTNVMDEIEQLMLDMEAQTIEEEKHDDMANLAEVDGTLETGDVVNIKDDGEIQQQPDQATDDQKEEIPEVSVSKEETLPIRGSEGETPEQMPVEDISPIRNDENEQQEETDLVMEEIEDDDTTVENDVDADGKTTTVEPVENETEAGSESELTHTTEKPDTESEDPSETEMEDTTDSINSNDIGTDQNEVTDEENPTTNSEDDKVTVPPMGIEASGNVNSESEGGDSDFPEDDQEELNSDDKDNMNITTSSPDTETTMQESNDEDMDSSTIFPEVADTIETDSSSDSPQVDSQVASLDEDENDIATDTNEKEDSEIESSTPEGTTEAMEEEFDVESQVTEEPSSDSDVQQESAVDAPDDEMPEENLTEDEIMLITKPGGDNLTTESTVDLSDSKGSDPNESELEGSDINELESQGTDSENDETTEQDESNKLDSDVEHTSQDEEQVSTTTTPITENDEQETDEEDIFSTTEEPDSNITEEKTMSPVVEDGLENEPDEESVTDAEDASSVIKDPAITETEEEEFYETTLIPDLDESSVDQDTEEESSTDPSTTVEEEVEIAEQEIDEIDTTPATDEMETEIEQEVTETSETQLLDRLANSTYKEICGLPVYPSKRIVGGTQASFGEWPWQVSLRQWRSVTFLHKCGAALVNSNWAITAAHCVENAQPDQILLRIGEYDLERSDEPYGHVERKVQIIATHPKFDPNTFEYDVALLRFNEPVTFQPNIIPICIPDNDYDFIGDTGFVTGWGRLYEDGPLPSVLQKVPVPVIPNNDCEIMYRNAGYSEHIPSIFICAGYEGGQRDSCEGDSGGPLVIQHGDSWKLAGVISWGIGCALPNQPGVYTRISAFRDWINKIMVF